MSIRLGTNEMETVFYNGAVVDGEINQGWLTVSTGDVKKPAVGDEVTAEGKEYRVVDDLKKRRPTLAPPRTHWRLPLSTIEKQPRMAARRNRK